MTPDGKIRAFPSLEQHILPIGQSVQASNVNNSLLDDTCRFEDVAQQIMRDINWAVIYEDQLAAITKS
jgi:hypothetical protein